MKKKALFVSVVIPTFNRSDFLGAAIESVLNQTYASLELHIIDDGSTDGTRELVSTYTDERLKYHYQSNKGQSTARNVGIQNATGDVICFLDSDNIWKLDKLERQVIIMECYPEIHIIYGENEIIDARGIVQASDENVKRYSGNIMSQLLAYNFVNFNTSMIRKECFDNMGGMNESTRAGEDYELFLKFSTQYTFLYMPVIYAQYRVMDDRISTNMERVYEYNHKILGEFFEKYSDIIKTDVKNYAWCRFYADRCRYYSKAGRRLRAISDFNNSVGYMPFSSIPWRALAKVFLR